MEHPVFLKKFYGERELAELEKRGVPAQSVAAAFAAKEAFSKALGTGISGFSLREVELLHEDSGKPYLFLSGSAKELAGKLSFDVSVTHTDALASATVIAWEEE